jgi:hypothetical protein
MLKTLIVLITLITLIILVTQLTLIILATLITLIIVMTLKALRTLITTTTLIAEVPLKINKITFEALNTLITIIKTQNLIIITTIGPVRKSHDGKQELKIWSESMTGKKTQTEGGNNRSKEERWTNI